MPLYRVSMRVSGRLMLRVVVEADNAHAARQQIIEQVPEELKIYTVKEIQHASATKSARSLVNP